MSDISCKRLRNDVHEKIKKSFNQESQGSDNVRENKSQEN